MRLDFRKRTSQFNKVAQFKIMIIIWRFIIRWVKIKKGAGLVIGLDKTLPGQMLDCDAGKAQVDLSYNRKLCSEG